MEGEVVNTEDHNLQLSMVLLSRRWPWRGLVSVCLSTGNGVAWHQRVCLHILKAGHPVSASGAAQSPHPGLDGTP